MDRIRLRLVAERLNQNIQVVPKMTFSRFKLRIRVQTSTWNVQVEQNPSSAVSSFSYKSRCDCSHCDICKCFLALNFNSQFKTLFHLGEFYIMSAMTTIKPKLSRFGSGLCSVVQYRAYRDRLKSMQILLSITQAEPGRTGKQEQEQTSRNHIQAFLPISVHIFKCCIMLPSRSVTAAIGTYAPPRSTRTGQV